MRCGSVKTGENRAAPYPTVANYLILKTLGQRCGSVRIFSLGMPTLRCGAVRCCLGINPLGYCEESYPLNEDS